MLCNKKTILKDPHNSWKAVEPLYGPAAAMRPPFMSDRGVGGLGLIEFLYVSANGSSAKRRGADMCL